MSTKHTAPLPAADLARLVALEANANGPPWELDEAADWISQRIGSQTFYVLHDAEAQISDLRLIVALRNAAPSLLAEVGRLRKVEEAARPFAAHWGEWLRARADHSHPDAPGSPLWRNYVTVARHVENLRAALAPSPEVPDER